MLKLISPLMKAKMYRRFCRPSVPYKINLHITYSCNSRCKTCFIWKRYADKPSMRENELKTGQWKEFFEKLGDKLYWLSISGGEPLLRDDLADIFSSVSTKNLCVLSINTNGQLPEKTCKVMKEILDILPGNVRVFLAVSLFGPEETHDFVSGRKNAFRKAEKTYDRLKLLRHGHKNFYVDRELVVNRHNLNEIPEIVNEMNRKKIPLTLTFAQESDYYDNMHADVGFSDEEKVMIGEMLKNLQIPVYQKEHVIKRRFQEIAVQFFRNGKMPKCYSSWSSVRIDPYGNVYPCIMKNEVIGNLAENGMDLEKTIMGSQNLRKIQKAIKNGECSCWTPCEAYQGIVQSLPLDIQALKMLSRRIRKS